MTVLNPVVQTWDGAARRIYLNQGVSDFYPIEDIYHEYRNARRVDENLRKFNPLLRAEGNVPKGAGAFTPRYVVLLEGTKIVPYNETLQINQLGDMITDNPDVDPTLYDTSTLTVPKVIYIKPSEAETIQLNSLAIEYSSYGGGVSLDIGSIYAGTQYPIGTSRNPVNNLSDAVSIANSNGFTTIFVLEDTTLDNSANYSNIVFVGESQSRTIITILPEANVLNAEFHNATITGTLDGNAKLQDCVVTTLNFVTGYIERCVLEAGTITLGGGQTASFLDCWSGVAGTSTPVINFGGSGQGLAVRNYNGGLTLTNKTGNDPASLDLNSGQLIVDNSVVAGSITLRGVGKWTNEDSYTGGATINNELVDGRKLEDVHKAHFNRRLWNKNNNTITIYADDGTTPLYIFDTNADLSNIAPQ